MRRAVAVLIALALTAAGCAPPAGASHRIRVVAKDLRFEPAALVAPAGTTFELVIDNRDRGVPHNLAIYIDEAATHPRFVGPTLLGLSEIRATIPPLAPGRYHYRCDIHPQMTGSLDAR